MKSLVSKIRQLYTAAVHIPELHDERSSRSFASGSALFSYLDRREEERNKIQKKYPIRFFLTETIPDLQKKSVRKINSAIWYCRYRTTDRYDIINMPTVSKSYHDKDYLFLHSIFNIIVDYVEVEGSIIGHSDDHEDSSKGKRSRYYGLKRLDWEIKETSGRQAESAFIIKELYLWWKDSYLLREDPYEFAEKCPGNSRDRMLISDALESFYYAEEQTMLHKAVEIRSSLWT